MWLRLRENLNLEHPFRVFFFPFFCHKIYIRKYIWGWRRTNTQSNFFAHALCGNLIKCLICFFCSKSSRRSVLRVLCWFCEYMHASDECRKLWKLIYVHVGLNGCSQRNDGENYLHICISIHICGGRATFSGADENENDDDKDIQNEKRYKRTAQLIKLVWLVMAHVAPWHFRTDHVRSGSKKMSSFSMPMDAQLSTLLHYSIEYLVCGKMWSFIRHHIEYQESQMRVQVVYSLMPWLAHWPSRSNWQMHFQFISLD